jgi:uncharacterized protein YbcC (UPF0753/DUF2309 family)
MKQNIVDFDLLETIHKIQHFLPAQASIKDFVHHNTLHAFQEYKFHEASRLASQWFGTTTYLSLPEYRNMLQSGEISHAVLSRILSEKYEDIAQRNLVEQAIYHHTENEQIEPSIKGVRNALEKHIGVNLSKYVVPRLYRIISSFLDQGIQSVDVFDRELDFLEALRVLERESFSSFFDTREGRAIFMNRELGVTDLLQMIIDDKALFEPYLFEQQMNHPGWSGFVSVVEHNPQTLMSERKISLESLIFLELALEIDAIYKKRGTNWMSLPVGMYQPTEPFMSVGKSSVLFEALAAVQEAYEWTYFENVLKNIQSAPRAATKEKLDFQAFFCIDDRSLTLRKHLHEIHENCETFGTPGFFGVEFYYQPNGAKKYTKSCPAPVSPAFLIREKGSVKTHKNEVHFSQETHGFVMGLIYSMTLGFWSILKLVLGTFKPADHAFASKAANHMHPNSQLEFEFKGEMWDGLRIGFTTEEMTLRVKNVLRSTGLVSNFADLVYIVGHGASSVNNPYYAGYDCGACCGRPGSVNARVFALMANKKEVRQALRQEGIDIPDSTVFAAALHDTTRDEITYFDEQFIGEHEQKHQYFKTLFKEALLDNAAERTNRFDLIDEHLSRHKKHELLKDKSNSLFEPRPEWNHTDNSLCIVGLPDIFEHVELDKRAFLNSYNYRIDHDGKLLEMILSAAIPVCGGINLEYYFSRMDQQKYGAGTKLPHNVIGLYALTNGVEDDLRPGLPSQMIEIHKPTRILFVVEQSPTLIHEVLNRNPKLLEWVENQWVWLVSFYPETKLCYRFEAGQFEKYEITQVQLIKTA